MRVPLPIDDVLGRLTHAVRCDRAAVLRAPTGAGKTSRVAPALLDAGLAADGPIVMLEPRRLAARAAARRIASERGCRLGAEVGYHVRFDRKASRETRILVVTEGIFLRMLQRDPMLERIGAVVFDEFHERSVDADLALAMVRSARAELRPDLPLVVMSATLDSEPIARWLGGAPTIESEGRTHPVTIEYRHTGTSSLEDAVVEAVLDAVPRTLGDMLVFLPGVGEIRRASRALEATAREHDLSVVELYGNLPPARQDAALEPGRRRKVVLATNVAETSVTVPGVTAVIDSGYRRVLRRDPSLGLDRLVLERISRSSADQRAGRAGRTEPGMCVRLWNESEHRAFADFDEAELLRADLAGPVLQLAAWGETDFHGFGWFESPPGDAIDDAVTLLGRLGALGSHGLTPLGRRLVSIPAHPRVARLLATGQQFGQPRRAALAAALLTEKSPFDAGTSPRSSVRRSASDVLDCIEAMEAFEKKGQRRCELGEIRAGSAQTILRARDQLERLLDRDEGTQQDRHGTTVRVDADEAILRAVAAAFPDRIARRRADDARAGRLVGGRGVRLARSSAVVEPELFACVDVDAGRPGQRSESWVRMASAVDRDWLAPDEVSTSIEVLFDGDLQRVVARRCVRYIDLVLDETPARLPDGDEVARILAEAVRTAAAAETGDGILAAFGNDALADFVTRGRCLREWRPDLGLPALDDAALAAWLPDMVRGCRGFADLARVDALSVVKGCLGYEHARTIDREAPERIEVPSGSRIRLQYAPSKPPVLAARIQELFGLADTPRIAGGRVAVLMHLLAPNQRPQQVTDDLRSFWDNTYPTVRKELRRRYPKHSWPEDPWHARAERRPQRKR